MAVLKSNRNESQLQFLDTARDLEIFTLRNCVKFPKRYTFFITTEIVRLSQSVYNNVKAANSIFPSGELEVQLRRDYLTKANCDLQCLISVSYTHQTLPTINLRFRSRWGGDH